LKVETFHSLPLNKKIFEAPLGIPEKKVMPVVEPESPAFALKQR
jgi:Cell cycle regulated microtubule associated protein